MEQNHLSREQRIWDFIDGSCTAEERAKVRSMIHTDAEWRSLYDQAMALQKTLYTIEPVSPSPHFVKEIMEKVDEEVQQQPAKTINRGVIFSVVLIFAVCLALAVIGSAAKGWPPGQHWPTSSPVFPRVTSDQTVTMMLIFVTIILALRLVEKLLAARENKTGSY